MEKLKAQKKAYKGHFSRCAESLKNELEKEEVDVTAIKKYKKSLDDKYNTLKFNSEKIQELEDDDKIAAEIDGLEEIYELYVELDSSAEAMLDKLKTDYEISKSQHNSTLMQAKTRFKLPEASIKKFTGEFEEYQEFYDSFMSSIHSNEELEDVDKFTYLKLYLDGDALELIAGFSTTNANYKEAMRLLKENYGREDLIISCHISKLLMLNQLKDSKDIKALRNLLNSIRTHLRSLTALKVNVSDHSIFVVPIILSKLPIELSVRWSKRKVKPDIDKLLDMVQAEVEGYESAMKVQDVFSTSQDEVKVQYQRKRYQDPRFPTAAALHIKAKKYCTICKENSTHGTAECKSFKRMNVNDRKSVCYEDFICFLCLEKGHLVKRCNQFGERKCEECNSSYHHSLLHEGRRSNKNEKENDEYVDRRYNKNEKENNDTVDSKAKETKTLATKTETTTNKIYSGSIFQTANAYLTNSDGEKEKVRLMFDTASDKSYILESKSAKLKMSHHKENLSISGFGATEVQSKECIVRHGSIVSKHNSNKFVNVELVETERITKDIRRQALPEHFLKHRYIQGLELAENYEVEDNEEIDILIGLDFYWDFITGKTRRQRNKPVLVESILGWIIQGNIQSSRNNIKTMCCASQQQDRNKISTAYPSSKQQDNELNQEIKKLFDLESIGILPEEKSCYNRSEQLAIDKFHMSATYNEEKEQWSVGLPWAGDKCLPRYEDLALRRLYKLEQRFKKNPEFEEKYRKAMEDYIEAGYAEEVPDDEIRSDKEGTSYQPHHAVIKDDRETTKVRHVFDGSCNEEGEESINDKLLPGPAKQPLLVDILIRFRIHQIALNSDIRKMYLNIAVNQEDRDSLRFLWRRKGEKKIRHFRHTVLPFGIRSSPFLAISTVHEHLKRKPPVNGLVAEVLINDMYMDDLLTGVESKTEAEELYKECKHTMKSASMEMVKWKSNHEEVTNCFEEGDRDKSGIKVGEAQVESQVKVEFTESDDIVEKCFKESPKHKVLGIHWLTEEDEFTFTVDKIIEKARNTRVTKRNVFSLASQLYDPLGMVSPYIVKIKMLMTKLWEAGYEWDEEVSKELSQIWYQWIEDMSNARDIHFSRCYHKSTSKIVSRTLHLFGDASEEAYAAVAYMVTQDEEGQCSSRIVMSRTRVAPIKRVTLPRLELLAALLAARLGKYITKALTPHKIHEVYYWTDSSITLSWIQSKSRELKPFVGNRVQEIQEITDPIKWKKVSGEENPADFPSRGMNLKRLIQCEEWWCGPKWLKNKDEWPQAVREVPTEEAYTTEYRKVLCLVNKSNQKIVSCIPPENNSRWRKLIGVTARIKRMFYNKTVKNRDNKIEGPLSTKELDEATDYWIKEVQSQEFSEEIVCLKEGKLIPNTSRLYELNPFYDSRDGYLRLTGRLQKSQLTEETKHPIVLPYNHHVVRLLVLDYHKDQLHAGCSHTLATVRNKYWIIKGRRQVKEALRSCLKCKMAKPKPLSVMYGPLPSDRITPQPPFTVVGIDFTGPLYVYQGDECKKMYICLYTCAVVRAVHLELVWDLTTESFLRSFRRFISIRGLCSTIYTDNAQTFKKANTELMKSLNLFKSKEFKEYLGEQRIEWKFIVPRAPWWGGFYESMMSSIKAPLKKILKNSLLDVDEMNTVLHEVSAMVNSRPLTRVTEDVTELEYLTPSKFLIGRQTMYIQTEDKTLKKSKPSEIRIRRRLQNQYLRQIWKEFIVKYLPNLSYKNPKTPITKLQVGQLIQVLDHSIPRQIWKTGIIKKLFHGKDDIARSVRVRIPNGKIIDRHVKHISLLEVDKYPDKNSEADIISNVFSQLQEEARRQVSSDFDDVDILEFCSERRVALHGGEIVESHC